MTRTELLTAACRATRNASRRTIPDIPEYCTIPQLQQALEALRYHHAAALLSLRPERLQWFTGDARRYWERLGWDDVRRYACAKRHVRALLRDAEATLRRHGGAS